VVKVIWQKATWPHMDSSIIFVRWRQCAPHLTHASLDPPEFTYQTEAWSVQSFLHSSRHTMRGGFSPQKCPLHVGSGPHLNYACLSIWYYSKTGCDDMGICCKKKSLIAWRNVWNMRWRAPDQEVDQRGQGERLCKKQQLDRLIWTRRMLWII